MVSNELLKFTAEIKMAKDILINIFQTSGSNLVWHDVPKPITSQNQEFQLFIHQLFLTEG